MKNTEQKSVVTKKFFWVTFLAETSKDLEIILITFVLSFTNSLSRTSLYFSLRHVSFIQTSSGKEHLDGMDRDVSQSVLRRHANDCHNGVIPDYEMNVTRVYHGDAMLRQITESIKIRREGSINNKTEWNSITLPHAAIVK